MKLVWHNAFSIFAIVVWLLAMWIVYSRASGNALISIFETRFGAPGTAHVVPECGCTFKYVGTNIRGKDYYVHFRQLD